MNLESLYAEYLTANDTMGVENDKNQWAQISAFVGRKGI
jgi:hypothetical protein